MMILRATALLWKTANFASAVPFPIPLKCAESLPDYGGGTGAPVLGLIGMIHEEPYHRAFRGFDPSKDKKLVQNAGKPNRRAGWEGVFSPPKCVSVLFSQMLPEDRARLQELHWRAVKATVRFIEEHFAFSRAGKAKDGCTRVLVGLVLAMFEHASARPTPNNLPDPDLHIHVQFLNLGVDEHLFWRSIEVLSIFENQKLITAYYDAKLAAELREEFGLRVSVTENGFHIHGIPRELIRNYSKRSQQIRDYMAANGQSGSIAAAYAALKTRSAKDTELSRKDLFEHWRQVNIAAGFDDKYVDRLLRRDPRRCKATPQPRPSHRVPEQPATNEAATADAIAKPAVSPRIGPAIPPLLAQTDAVKIPKPDKPRAARAAPRPAAIPNMPPKPDSPEPVGVNAATAPPAFSATTPATTPSQHVHVRAEHNYGRIIFPATQPASTSAEPPLTTSPQAQTESVGVGKSTTPAVTPPPMPAGNGPGRERASRRTPCPRQLPHSTNTAFPGPGRIRYVRSSRGAIRRSLRRAWRGFVEPLGGICPTSAPE